RISDGGPPLRDRRARSVRVRRSRGRGLLRRDRAPLESGADRRARGVRPARWRRGLPDLRPLEALRTGTGRGWRVALSESPRHEKAELEAQKCVVARSRRTSSGEPSRTWTKASI